MPKVEMLSAALGELGAPGTAEELNDNQKALLAFSAHLEEETPIAARPRAAMAQSMSNGKLAKERVRAFLDQSKPHGRNP
jgi:hypothetical protein